MEPHRGNTAAGRAGEPETEVPAAGGRAESGNGQHDAGRERGISLQAQVDGLLFVIKK